MADDSSPEEEELRDDIKRIQEVLESDTGTSIEQPGVSQADRIIDKINQTQKEIHDHNRESELIQDRLTDISEDIETLKSTRREIRTDIDDFEESVDERFEEIDDKLDNISESTGIHFPEGSMEKLTLSASIGLISFSVISILVAIFDASQVTISAQIAAAGGLGLIVPEVLDYIKQR